MVFDFYFDGVTVKTGNMFFHWLFVFRLSSWGSQAAIVMVTARDFFNLDLPSFHTRDFSLNNISNFNIQAGHRL